MKPYYCDLSYPMSSSDYVSLGCPKTPEDAIKILDIPKELVGLPLRWVRIIKYCVPICVDKLKKEWEVTVRYM